MTQHSRNTCWRLLRAWQASLDKSKLLTDRTAYLSFLETQLERVSTACLTVQGVTERFSETQGQLDAADEKAMQSLYRPLKTRHLSLFTNTPVLTIETLP